MRITEKNANINAIFTRAHQLMIGVEYALVKQGIQVNLNPQDTEQLSRRRELLDVEEKTNKSRLIDDHEKQQFRDKIELKFNRVVERKIDQEIDDLDRIFNGTLIIEDAVAGIMDILSVRAASVGRIKLLVGSIFWLCEELIAFVNKPQYRKNNDVKVNDPILAMNYIGLENVKKLMPTLLVKHWLPHNTTPYKTMKRKLWSDSLAVGLAAQALAKREGIDEFTLFCAGMFSRLGYFAISRSYLTFYDKLIQHELQKAYQAKNKKLHDVLLTIQPSADFLASQLQVLAPKLSANMIKRMGFERLWITNAIDEWANCDNIAQASPMAQVLMKATAYVNFKALLKVKLLSADEAKMLLAYFKISADEFALLQKTDLTNLNLVITGND